MTHHPNHYSYHHCPCHHLDTVDTRSVRLVDCSYLHVGQNLFSSLVAAVVPYTQHTTSAGPDLLVLVEAAVHLVEGCPLVAVGHLVEGFVLVEGVFFREKDFPWVAVGPPVEVFVPLVEDIVPLVEGFVPLVEGFVPLVEDIVPLVEGFVPLVEGFVPLVEGFVPLVEDIVPLVEGFVPLVEGFVPLVEDIVPLVEDIVPLVEGFVPLVEGFVPLVEGFVPLVEDIVPLVEGFVPLCLWVAVGFGHQECCMSWIQEKDHAGCYSGCLCLLHLLQSDRK